MAISITALAGMAALGGQCRHHRADQSVAE
jgi:hypothetical protein